MSIEDTRFGGAFGCQPLPSALFEREPRWTGDRPDGPGELPSPIEGVASF